MKHKEPIPGSDSTAAQRRTAAANAFEQARQRGTPVEDDPRFLSWIDQWVAGDMTMVEVRQRYGQLQSARRMARKMHMPGVTPLPDVASEPQGISDSHFTFDEAELNRILQSEIDDETPARNG
ncbi:hypothetical protein [Rhizobium tubonense]|uniref:hypothetical protein n=1 Tax=Rhizobium tubonense TaxID=484088 RepID=UPI0011B52143|nr:hypothetical protein [Rhizobium tubonense]